MRKANTFGSLLVIDTPGHIHGHHYAGDEFGSIGQLSISGFTPWWFPMKAFSNSDQAKETAKKLQTYPIKRVACGHGKVLEGGSELLRGAIDRANA